MKFACFFGHLSRPASFDVRVVQASRSRRHDASRALGRSHLRPCAPRWVPAHHTVESSVSLALQVFSSSSSSSTLWCFVLRGSGEVVSPVSGIGEANAATVSCAVAEMWFRASLNLRVTSWSHPWFTSPSSMSCNISRGNELLRYLNHVGERVQQSRSFGCPQVLVFWCDVPVAGLRMTTPMLVRPRADPTPKLAYNGV